MTKRGYVYIMASGNNNALYTGVTSRLAERVYEHKTHANKESFTAKYNCVKLVWYVELPSIEEAIAEEKRIKSGNRWQKVRMITEMNPEWNDLWTDIASEDCFA